MQKTMPTFRYWSTTFTFGVRITVSHYIEFADKGGIVHSFNDEDIIYSPDELITVDYTNEVTRNLYRRRNNTSKTWWYNKSYADTIFWNIWISGTYK